MALWIALASKEGRREAAWEQFQRLLAESEKQGT
jgi:hypothetical protein